MAGKLCEWRAGSPMRGMGTSFKPVPRYGQLAGEAGSGPGRLEPRQPAVDYRFVMVLVAKLAAGSLVSLLASGLVRATRPARHPSQPHATAP
jgi:hypothetical protein